MYPDDSKISKAAVDVIRETHGKLLTHGIGNLINRLNLDLWYGPAYVVESDEWPHQLLPATFGEWGARQADFGADCTELEEYLECLGTLWYDSQSGYWHNTEPTGCWENTETGEVVYDQPDDYEPRYTEDDDDTDDNVWEFIDVFWEEWAEVDRRTMLRALLGAELAQHI